MNTTTISIIIPLYNEAENLPFLSDKLKDLSFTGLEKEVLFIDDSSSDTTPYLLKQICNENPNFNFLRLSKNSGSHIAILAGMQFAKGDAIVFMAGDLQDPPELIMSMVSEWQNKYDVVWAVRETVEGVSFFQKIFSRLFYKLMNTFGNVTFPPKGADFALMDKKAVSAVLKTVGSSPSLGGAIAAVGFKQTEIKYVKQSRAFGKSKWTLTKKLQAFVDAFVAFSFAPMRLMIYAGFIFALLGFSYAMFIIISRIFFIHQSDGWASLMVVILILGGLQMIMLGILGEYLWRNLEEARKKPLFFIESKSEEV